MIRKNNWKDIKGDFFANHHNLKLKRLEKISGLQEKLTKIDNMAICQYDI